MLTRSETAVKILTAVYDLTVEGDNYARTVEFRSALYCSANIVADLWNGLDKRPEKLYDCLWNAAENMPTGMIVPYVEFAGFIHQLCDKHLTVARLLRKK